MGIELTYKTNDYGVKQSSEYIFSNEWMYISVGLPYLTINIRQHRLDKYTGKAFLVDYPLDFVYGPEQRCFQSVWILLLQQSTIRTFLEGIIFIFEGGKR